MGGEGEELIFAQLGANDPNFNLRNEGALIHRVESSKDHIYVSVLEPHGEYNGRAEYTVNAKSNVVDLSSSYADGINIVGIGLVSGGSITLVFTERGDQTSKHKIEHNGRTIEWVGHYTLING